MDTTLDLLRRYAALPKDERDAFAFRNPVLLREDVLTSLSQELDGLPGSSHRELRPVLQDLHTLVDSLKDGSKRYRIGLGPLESILMQIERGEIEIEYGEQLARSPEVVNNLAPYYALHLSVFADDMMRDGSAWKNALLLQRLLLAASSQLPAGKDSVLVRRVVALDWVEIVAGYLRRLPDGRLLRSATRVGEQMLAEANAEPDRNFIGQMYHRLGALYLDPYTAGRDNYNFVKQTEIWLRTLDQEYGEGLPGFSDEQRQEMMMPKAEDAMQSAEHYFRQALPYREGSDKGRSLKALLQTITWKEVLGLPVDKSEFARIGREAIDSLDYRETAGQRLAVLGMLKRAGQTVDPEESKHFFSIAKPEYLQRLLPGEAVDILMQASRVFMEQAPRECLALLTSARELFDQFPDESYRHGRVNTMFFIIASYLSPRLPKLNDARDMLALAERLDQATDLDDATISAGLVGLANQATKIDREDLALNLLQSAVQKAPDFWQDLEDVILFYEGLLTTGLAVNALNRGDLPETVNFYIQSLGCYADLKFRGQVNDLLVRVDDVISQAGTNNDVAHQVIVGLAEIALKLEASFGQSAIDKIQDLLVHSLMIMDSQAMNPEALNFLFQTAKGLRFTAALNHQAHFDPTADPIASDLLQQIFQMEAALDQPESLEIDEDTILDQNLLLSAYIQGGEQQSGDTPQERLSNLQQSFDAYVNEQLISPAAVEQPRFWSVEEVQNLLDERSVLLNFYLGSNPAAQLAIFVYLFTREDSTVSGAVHNFPLSKVFMTVGDKQIYVTPFALTVGSLRDNVIAEPGPWPVSRNAARTLMGDVNGYLGGLDKYLEKLRRAGKEHLIIVPHGPLHFYPFHLLGGEPGKLLAEQWKVTYLPTLSLLENRPVKTRRVSKQMTAIGMRFEQDNAFGLAPLPESEKEVRAVAAIFQSQPLLDQQATKKAVFEALQSSRYVHISTHGKHNINAAFFQCIYLAPDGDSDGRLYAYELLPLDLRGVELVTLSACETALGRFDNADNLRGLPAALLLAGVRTIIGTLWPVAPQPAELFFSTLYQEVKKQTGLLDAFYIAQTATRNHFPQFRDWGPFYLIGQTD